MQIILLETLSNLGKAGEVVSVKDGFAKNFLIPQKKAVIANKKNVSELESKMSQINENNNAKIKEANDLKSKLDQQEISIYMESNDEGNLYGNVGVKQVLMELKNKYDVSLSPENIILGNIKSLGSYSITVRLYDDISAELKVEIIKKS